MKNSICRLLLRNNFYKVCFLVVIVIATLNSYIFSNIILMSGNVINVNLKKVNGDLYTILYQMLLFIALWLLLNIFYYVFTNSFIEKNLSNLRNNILSVILYGDMHQLEENMHMESVSLRANSDIEKLENILTGDFLWFLRVIINALFALVNCIILNYQLSMVFIIFPISFFLVKNISKPIRKRKINSFKYVDNAMALMLETLRGLPILKSFNLENKVICEFNEFIEKSKIENIKNEKTNLLLVATNYIVQVLQLFIILVIGMFMVYNGYLLPGAFVSIILLSNNIRFAIRMSSDIFLCLHEISVLCERVMETLDIKLEKKQENTTYQICKTDNTDCLKIENLCFKHGKKNIFNNLSIKINQNEKIAILGKSGCGKTTLVKLLCGFYDDYEGQISIYQNDIRKIGKNFLRKQISIVTQDVFIVNGSIYENIVLYNKDVDIKTVSDVIKKCCLDHLITSLPNGLNTIIGDGGINLSQGEKQRISIARAILKNAPIVIMDEATAYLDNNTEESILLSLEYLLKNKTAIIITHKQSILKLADRKYIMQDGNLISSKLV